MAIGFSIGFAVEDRPKKAIICVCSAVVPEVEVTTVIRQQVEVVAVWPRNPGPC